MKFNFWKSSKKVMLTVVLATACLGTAAVGYADAKAYEPDQILRSSYRHTMSNEFAMMNANIYNSTVPAKRWGEVNLFYLSGMDGSRNNFWYIGDLMKLSNGEFALQVKRRVEVRKDDQQRETLHKVEDVDFVLKLYIQDESSFKLVKGRAAESFKDEAVGDYHSFNPYPNMSEAAAMYVLERFLKASPEHKQVLPGAAIMHTFQNEDGVHEFKVVEHHQTHVVTRGQFRVLPSGDILEYDVVSDAWKRLTE